MRNHNYKLLIFGFVFLIASVAVSASINMGLGANWRMDTGSGNVIPDIFQLNNITRTTGELWYPSGKINSAINCTGNSTALSATGFSMPNVFSLNLWVKIKNLTSTTNTFWGAYTSGSNSFSLMHKKNIGITFDYFNATTEVLVNMWDGTGGTRGNTTNWQMLTFVRNNTDVQWYQNATKMHAGKIYGVSSAPFYLCGYKTGGGLYFNGVVDEVNYYNRTLSASDVTTLFNSGVGLQFPPYTKIKAKWGINNSWISKFNVTYNSGLYQTTNGTIWVSTNSSNYNMTAKTTKGQSLLSELNATSRYVRSYNFTMYNINSVNIHFYDEVTGNLIKTAPSNINVRTSSSIFLQSNSTKNGSLFISTLAPADYIIQYNATNATANWVNKFYYFTVGANDPPLLLNLFMSRESTSNVVFEVFDQFGNPVSGAKIKILRQVTGNSNYVVVTMGKTDVTGSVTLPVVLNTVLYEVYVEYNGVLQNNPQITPIQTTLVIFTISPTGNLGTNINFIGGVTSILSNDWKNGTSWNTTYQWSDSTNTITAGCVKVFQTTASSNTLINSSCTNSPSGTSKVRIYKTLGTYVLKGSVIFGGHEYVLSTKTLNLTTDNAMKDKGILFMILFLVFTLGILGFIVSPPIGFVLFGIGLIAMGFLTVISFGVAMPLAIVMFILAIIISKRS